MGRYYELKCEKCSYEFTAKYGGGRGTSENVEFQKQMESGKGENRLQEIYDAMKRLVSEEEKLRWKMMTEKSEDSVVITPPLAGKSENPYQCGDCNYLFNHKRIHIFCEEGEFIQRYVKCPKCGKPEASPLDENEMNVFVKCPRCGEIMVVKNRGFWD